MTKYGLPAIGLAEAVREMRMGGYKPTHSPSSRPPPCSLDLSVGYWIFAFTAEARMVINTASYPRNRTRPSSSSSTCSLAASGIDYEDDDEDENTLHAPTAGNVAKVFMTQPCMTEALHAASKIPIDIQDLMGDISK